MKSVSKIFLFIAGIVLVIWGCVAFFNHIEYMYADPTLYFNDEHIIDSIWNLVYDFLEILGGVFAMIYVANQSKGTGKIVFVYSIIFLVTICANIGLFAYGYFYTKTIELTWFYISNLIGAIIVPVFYCIGGFMLHAMAKKETKKVEAK